VRKGKPIFFKGVRLTNSTLIKLFNVNYNAVVNVLILSIRIINDWDNISIVVVTRIWRCAQLQTITALYYIKILITIKKENNNER